MTTSRTRTWILILSSVASLMVALDALVVSTALSTIRLDLGASIEQLEWTVNAYNLSFAVLLLTGAAIGDRLGRRRVFAGGLALFVAASAACALAPRRHADRRAGGPGRRRGRHHADGAGAAERELPFRAARPRHGGLLRHHRSGRPQRPRRRRGPRAGRGVGVDLLGQRPDRPPRHPARAAAHARELRRSGAHRRGGPGRW